MRPDAAHLGGDSLLRDSRIDAVERTVGVPENDDLTDTKFLRCRAKLRLASRPDDFQSWTLLTVAETTTLAPRRGHDERLDPFRGVFRQRPARPQRLVVGVGEDAHQSQCLHRVMTVSRYSAGTTRPASPPRSAFRSSAINSPSSAA